MRPLWVNLNERDQAAFRITITFLSGRLEERSTINWALQLKANDVVKRLALLQLIDSPDGEKLNEPWRSAWRLIEEHWNNSVVADHASTGVYRAQHRLRSGDRSISLVTKIVELVAPRLKVNVFSSSHLHSRKMPTRPKRVADLFSMGLTSGEVIDPDILKLGDISDPSFLVSLALALDAAVIKGLDIARGIGWEVERNFWLLGSLHRVYYVPPADRSDEEDEPDRYHQGIAPSVKLLHAVVSRLVDIDLPAAVEYVRRWKLTNSPIHLRLWAALSLDPRVTAACEVGVLLLSLDDRRFWKLHDYPEIAELRAKRFTELDPYDQKMLTARIRKRPPRNQWPKGADTERVENARLYLALQELRRIENAGFSLPKHDKAWLDAKISDFPSLVQMDRFDEGFMQSPKARFVAPKPDSRFDVLAGEERLKALEVALTSARNGWDDDPAERATDWIRLSGNAVQVIGDLESCADGGGSFARVWEKFGWSHSPVSGQDEDVTKRDLFAESARVLSLLVKLPDTTLLQSINGISHWLSTWEKLIVTVPDGLKVWLKLWPIAVLATNARQSVEEENLLNTVASSSGDREPMDLDTLNTPAGKLVGVFLVACPTVHSGDTPFSEGNIQRSMRDSIEAALGAAGSIVKYRLIEHLPYFLAADKSWSLRNLVAPLLADNSPEVLTLWRAVARQRLSFEVIAILANVIVDRAIDSRLGRETRRSLVFRIVVDCLHAFKDLREPAVSHARIQQMIRSLDDEVRSEGAEAIQRFVRDVSTPHDGKPNVNSPEQIFQSVAAPFLQKVWPQERSLATPGVSRALADLPSAAEGAFAEAVYVIERFLVPFECWSMLDYGLYGEEDGNPKLSSIDNHSKAIAFLRLLDLTIGTTEGAVIPHDLAEALDQVRKTSPNLAENQVFRRLATAARRG